MIFKMKLKNVDYKLLIYNKMYTFSTYREVVF